MKTTVNETHLNIFCFVRCNGQMYSEFINHKTNSHSHSMQHSNENWSNGRNYNFHDSYAGSLFTKDESDIINLRLCTLKGMESYSPSLPTICQLSAVSSSLSTNGKLNPEWKVWVVVVRVFYYYVVRQTPNPNNLIRPRFPTAIMKMTSRICERSSFEAMNSSRWIAIFVLCFVNNFGFTFQM